MATNGIKLSYGTCQGPFLFAAEEEVKTWLDVIDEVGIKLIDAARVYGEAEVILAKTGAPSRFIIDTKVPGGAGEQPSTKDVVIAQGKESLRRLNVDSVDVLYIHAPDRRVPLKETLSGANELYKQGAFKRLGISNFLADEIEEAVRIAKENDFVVPSVYQGSYSAVARRTEDEIMPVLRKHGFAFYAYSPIAGGFLSKPKAELLGDEESRFGKNNPLSTVYNDMYNRPSFLAALNVWDQIAKDEGVPHAELAYRWIVYHSKLRGEFGDALVLGARKHQQLRDTVAAIKKGPLSESAVKRIDGMWELVKDDAYLDNFEMRTSKNYAPI